MKKNYALMLLLLICSLLTFQLQAQDIDLSGQVTDEETGEPLGFVNVSVKVGDDLKGAQTDFDGMYQLTLPPGTHTITYSYIGYAEKQLTETFAAGETRTINISMGEEQELLDAVVVTGGKFEQKLGEQTVSLEVIKPTFVENSNNTSIDQTIEKVPGVDVVDGQANIRGGSGYSYGAGSRVMLLMDDLPVLTADAGFPNWGFLPIENLEQVEIVKGAASALYGSAALNGIINLRTAYPKSKPYTKISLFSSIYQNPRDNEVIIRSEDGNPIDTLKKGWWQGNFPFETGLSFAHRQKFGNFDLVTGAYLFSQDSWRQNQYDRRYRLNANTRYRFPGIEGLSAGLNINYQHNTSASFLIWDMDEGVGEGAKGLAGAYQLWDATPQINNIGLRWTIDPFLEYFTQEGFKVKLLGRWFKADNTTDTQQSTLSDLYYGELQLQKRWEKANFTITGGVATTLGDVDAELYGNAKYQSTNVAGYLQLDKKFFNKLNLSLGSRYEYNKITDSEAEALPVFRAGLNYEAAEYTFIRASWGQGYRFPTIAEKFIQTNLGAVPAGPLSVEVGIFPNPNLQSETGWSAELGVKQGFKISDWNGFIDVTGFINEYNDMMEFTFGVPQALIDAGLLKNIYDWDLDTTLITFPEDAPPLSAGFQSINIGDTRIFGGDISIAGQGNLFGLPTGLLMGYTYINPKFQDFNEIQNVLSSADENVLKYRFRHTFKVDAETTIKKVAVGFSIRHFSFMEAIDEAFNKILPGIEKFRMDNDGGITVVDGRLMFNFSEKSSIAFIVKNLLNNEYALRPALIDAPRNFTIKFTHDLSPE